MRTRYLIFIGVTFAMNLFFWYYIIVFSAVYTTTSVIWFLSCLQALVIDWFMLKLIQPVGYLLIKILCQRYKGLM
jgi:hypothetical protein